MSAQFCSGLQDLSLIFDYRISTIIISLLFAYLPSSKTPLHSLKPLPELYHSIPTPCNCTEEWKLLSLLRTWRGAVPQLEVGHCSHPSQLARLDWGKGRAGRMRQELEIKAGWGKTTEFRNHILCTSGYPQVNQHLLFRISCGPKWYM